MARVNKGSHNFTCHPHVYPQVESAIPAFDPQPQSITALWLVLIFHWQKHMGVTEQIT